MFIVATDLQICPTLRHMKKRDGRDQWLDLFFPITKGTKDTKKKMAISANSLGMLNVALTQIPRSEFGEQLMYHDTDLPRRSPIHVPRSINCHHRIRLI